MSDFLMAIHGRLPHTCMGDCGAKTAGFDVVLPVAGRLVLNYRQEATPVHVRNGAGEPGAFS